METTKKKEKTIGLKFILGWIFGLVLLFAGVIELFNRPASGVFSVLAALVIFPPSMQFVQSKTGIRFSAVLRIVIFLILVGIGTGLNLNKERSVNPTSEPTNELVNEITPTPTPIDIELVNFTDEYEKNKVTVQSKYSGKRLRLTGFIDNISSSWDQYYVELAPTNYQYYFGITIRCYFVNKADLIDNSKGESVTISGTLKDSSYETFIELHDCSLEK